MVQRQRHDPFGEKDVKKHWFQHGMVNVFLLQYVLTRRQKPESNTSLFVPACRAVSETFDVCQLAKSS